MLVTSYRVVKFAFQNFWRNFWLSLITVSMLVLTLITINVLILLNVVTDRAIEIVEERIEVSVYFNAGTDQERVNNAAGYLRGLAQVRDVEVITAEEALQKFEESHATDAAILASLDEVEGNPFGPTLIVKSYSAEDFPFILDALDNPQFRADIREKDFSDYEQIIDRIRGTTDRIRMFGLALSGVFLVIAMLIVFNTVRIGIFVHREEIGIMKLVGATNRFVRVPFLIESVVYSFIATAIVAAVMYPLVGFMEPRFDAYFDGQSTHLVNYFIQHGPVIFLTQFTVLTAITVVSTIFAMRKYLKV